MQFCFTLVIVPDTENTLLDCWNTKRLFCQLQPGGIAPWLAFHHSRGLVSEPSTSFVKDSSLSSGAWTVDLLEMSPSNISRALFFWMAASLASTSLSSV